MEYKAYSFDLDDNLLKIPTSVYLKDKDDNIKEFSTLEFEKIRGDLEKLQLREFSDSFSGFLSDEQFFSDLKKSEIAGSWRNLVNCVTKYASIFAIITARGNSKESLREGIKLSILKRFKEKDWDNFRTAFEQKISKNAKEKTNKELLDIYLDLCKFYPVNNKEIKKEFGDNLGTSELKAVAFEKFQEYVNLYVKEKFGDKCKIKIGFSDDSLLHLRSIVNSVLKKHGLFFYQTKDTGKESFL